MIFNDLKGVGKRLYELRLQLGYSNAGVLGEKLGGVSAPSITRWEQGKVEPPLDYIAYIARESGVDLNWIIFGGDNALNATSVGEAPNSPVAAVSAPAPPAISPERELELLRKVEALTDELLAANDEIRRLRAEINKLH